MKIGIVIQRYGLDVIGGAEFLCRHLAEHLSKHFQIDVLTTCSKDYITWNNEYSPGRSRVNGVTVIRFQNTKTRNLEEFNKFSDWIYRNAHTKEDELRWLDDQGPVCPDLISYIKQESRNYQLMIFFTYLYYSTYYGIKECECKVILIPTAHDEPAIKLSIYKDVISKANAIIFNTPAEKTLVQNLFDIDSKISPVIGVGVRIPSHLRRGSFKKKNGLDKDYICFGGRIDAGKGCQEMLEFYLRYRGKYSDYPLLVLFGRLEMPLPAVDDIIYTGFISEQEKIEILAGARAVIVPSAYESLSLILLEGFSCGIPALVNASSPVLKEHCVHSNGGLFYSNYEEFEKLLDLLLHEHQLRNILARNGLRYVRSRYSWSKVINEYLGLMHQLSPR